MDRLTECVGYHNNKPIYRAKIDMRKIGAVDKLKQALGEYEDAEEQGLLLKLPCKVGDTLYRIDTDEKIENVEIEPFFIEYIVICEKGDVLFKYDAYDGVICNLENIITDKPYLDYYRVFLTKEEAEQALRLMQKREKYQKGE
ncbi:MAG: hypothetical protein J6A75_13530 [Lachnospiraceae bacterium]|nr:hypothetical protein [Lachnospiraceae bacterium]